MPRIVATVLLAGIALRAALTIALPVETWYDNHAEPVRIIVEKGRIPDAADCWECYQPPAYYALSAATWTVGEGLATLAGAPQRVAREIGKKSMQWVSCAAGCLTLYLTLLILRRARISDPAVQAAALAVVAFLPAHIRISGMATNDALTHCVATAAILATLRAHDRSWPADDCIVAGALAGASVLCKAYGAVTVAAIAAAVVLECWATRRRVRAARLTPELLTAAAPRSHPWLAPPLWILLAALLTGSGPALRNAIVFEKLQVDNFEKFDTPMRFQPPGAASKIDYFSFRFGALLTSPWLHTSHLDSFWTELYGRMWFDYEGFRVSLSGYPPWEAHWKRASAKYPRWNPERWNALLSYAPADVPPHFRWMGVAMYVLGLPLTALILAGIAIGVIRTLRSLTRPASHPARFAATLLTLHFFAALCVPMVQSLRLPVFSAMKIEFALSALSSLVYATALALSWSPGRKKSLILIFTAPLLAAVALLQTLYVLLQFLLARGQ